MLYCLSHPIQYQSPLIRHLVAGGLCITVAYGSGATGSAYHDREFGTTVKWDVPLLDGYDSVTLEEAKWEEQLMQQPADAIWVHGWSHPYAAVAWKVAARRRLPLLVRGETFLGCVRGGPIRRWMHRQVYSRRFRRAAAFLAVGSLNAQMYRAYGVPAERIYSVPYAVDNAFFQARAAEARPGREALRESLQLEPGLPVVLFCGKLIAKKNAATLIEAMGRLNSRAALVLVGDGELKPELTALAERVMPGRARFVGFKNQTELPAYYDMCDVFVIPSTFEPWGLVVNEVMNAGKPVLASHAVGSAADLVGPDNGGSFHATDAADLARVLKPYLEDEHVRQQAGARSLEKIQRWGFEEDRQGLMKAMEGLKRAA
ncbi:MAG: glycosyltransferase family 4 protein [Verrucomicrobiaceae bacterium]|nr:glycosyltransferase family 4 protein [Verrucomicrobiaceae bacterium]